ncbi:MAG: S9 family peptidase [bacterium]|nr:S9 family peptidase [bacterium]
MDVDTGEILPDTLRGQKQIYASWLPDNEGFYYYAKPLPGEVPLGEEKYWTAAYYHKLGTDAEEDIKVFYHDEVKEYFHYATVSEDGKYAVYYRATFNSNEVFFKEIGSDGPLTSLATGFDAEYRVDIIDDSIYIVTDSEAPMFKTFVTDIGKPEREHWREFIPEDNNARLNYLVPVAGRLYAVYEEKAHTVIRVFDGDGGYLRDVALPILGNATVSGLWSKTEVWVNFTSFTYPHTYFRYDFDDDILMEYWRYPIEVDVDSFTAEQVWYDSKDGTPVSMFLIHRKDLKRNGNNPVLLTGYGGFNNSITPYFSGLNVAWLEAGGMIAKPNLRGGGEYGREWHEAGMREKKQNVFDDFIAAAEWLIADGYTCPGKLAIRGGSNGGLLVGAVTVQRPELFAVVSCTVPLLDMIRFHKFDFANVWTEEYGSPDDPDDFKYIYKYSPYHNVVDGADYPAMMITASENDARVNPLHARKMIARMQESDPDGEPILYRIQRDSGHGYGTTLSALIEQYAEEYAFLMYRLGMEAPE